MMRAFWSVFFLVVAYLQLCILDYEIRVWQEYQYRKDHPYSRSVREPKFRIFPSMWDF